MWISIKFLKALSILDLRFCRSLDFYFEPDGSLMRE